MPHDELDMQHFERLQARVNERLRALNARYAEYQIERCPWLYGALGQVPSRVMFICENPSRAGVETAEVDTPDGGPPDIETQWWGGPRNNAAKRFRHVLHQLGLKTTPPQARGGWRCYITNAVKQINIATAQGALRPAARDQQAREWAEILAWEYDEVKPDHVFCVGGMSARFVRFLQGEGRLPRFYAHRICHYSARKSDDEARSLMAQGIRQAWRPDQDHPESDPLGDCW